MACNNAYVKHLAKFPEFLRYNFGNPDGNITLVRYLLSFIHHKYFFEFYEQVLTSILLIVLIFEKAEMLFE